MSAVPLVQDDRFWPDNPCCPLYEPEAWRSEVEAFLDARAVASEHAADGPAATRNRGWRRRIMRSRIRGIRPTDLVELTATPWYRVATKKRQPMVKCTATLPVLTREGTLEMRTRRRRFAPAPNRRLTLVPPVEDSATELTAEAVTPAATTEVAISDELTESEVILEASRADDEPLAVVLVPTDDGAMTVLGLDDDDEPDRELVSLLCGEPLGPQFIELPAGFHVEDGGGALSRRAERERLAKAAQIEPDWGDPEQWNFGRSEPTYLPTSA